MSNEKQVKVLLLEDNPGDARLIAELIYEVDSKNFLIHHVSSVNEAITELSSSYNVILSDLNLPDSSGVDTYRSLRSNAPDLPIIILSGNTDESMAITAVKEGAQDYLVKGRPDGEALIRSIRYGIQRKETERELEQLRTQQQQSAKMASLGEMAGGVAHEINTPLGAILLTSQSLRSSIESFDPSQKNLMIEMAELIEQTTNRISKIVKSLKTFSRNSNKDPFAETKLSEIVDGAVSLCTEKFSHMGIALEIDFESLNNVSIQCRESEVTQVILNLLTNARDAIEYLDDKWIKIFCQDHGETVNLYIVDSGAGIPQKVLKKVFDPFFSSKDIGKGTGLGLSISKGIIDSHGGALRVDENAKNTTFIIQLPKIQKEHAEQIFKEVS